MKKHLDLARVRRMDSCVILEVILGNAELPPRPNLGWVEKFEMLSSGLIAIPA